MKNKIFVVFILIIFFSVSIFSETYNGEPSNRVKINLGATPWKFIKSDIQNAQNPSFNDASWKTVGLPHTWNDTDTYINKDAGGPGPAMGGIGWYRKKFTLDKAYSNRKIFVEFEASHVGCQVYINGTFIKGNSALNPNATHVIGFLPFVVDLTPYVKFLPDTNVLAVRVSGSEGFYQFPTFSIDFRFGQGDYGLWRPVWMHITDKVYVPLNVYSVVNNWGTYVSTISATDALASIKILTNVQNDNSEPANVTLITKIVDANKNVVWTEAKSQIINANSNYVFDQTAEVTNPKLWYPANSIYGKPNMYKVFHIVKVNNVTVDVFQSPLGIRVITWDKDFPIINGHPHYLWGGASRYDYPALGTAVPEEQQWRDAKLLVEAGGNLWRPGHSTHSPEFTAACDAYGIMLVQPSGELEGNFATAQITDYKKTLKRECHRDMIIRDRNNPSILAWEVSNGPIDPDYCRELHELEHQLDPVNTRAQSDRGFGEAGKSGVADIYACSATGCEISLHSGYPDKPAWGAEAWGGSRAYRFDYDNELTFANEYVQNWKKSKRAKCFGLVHWYLMDTPGESGLGRSFASSMMDFNRIPKMLYHIYKACWTPYKVKPVISLAHHWNRSGNVTVNAFTNCPKARLLINGVSQGERVPYPDTGTGTALMPTQCQWNVTFQAGTLRAEGLDENGNVVCFDEKKTAGAPHHVVLTVEPPLVKPDGDTFKIYANGTDAAFILATIVDADGNWCPTANNKVTFSVSGPGNYRGGSDHTVTSGQSLYYHSPLDPELNAEGGMCKVVVRATFTPGDVTVSATASGLQGTATTTFRVYPLPPEPSVSAQNINLSKAAPLYAYITTKGKLIKYFINQDCNADFEVMNAKGSIIFNMPKLKQKAGWHYVDLNKAKINSGIYFIRIKANGEYNQVKKVTFFTN